MAAAEGPNDWQNGFELKINDVAAIDRPASTIGYGFDASSHLSANMDDVNGWLSLDDLGHAMPGASLDGANAVADVTAWLDNAQSLPEVNFTMQSTSIDNFSVGMSDESSHINFTVSEHFEETAIPVIRYEGAASPALPNTVSIAFSPSSPSPSPLPSPTSSAVHGYFHREVSPSLASTTSSRPSSTSSSSSSVSGRRRSFTHHPAPVTPGGKKTRAAPRLANLNDRARSMEMLAPPPRIDMQSFGRRTVSVVDLGAGRRRRSVSRERTHPTLGSTCSRPLESAEACGSTPDGVDPRRSLSPSLYASSVEAVWPVSSVAESMRPAPTGALNVALFERKSSDPSLDFIAPGMVAARTQYGQPNMISSEANVALLDQLFDVVENASTLASKASSFPVKSAADHPTVAGNSESSGARSASRNKKRLQVNVAAMNFEQPVAAQPVAPQPEWDTAGKPSRGLTAAITEGDTGAEADYATDGYSYPVDHTVGNPAEFNHSWLATETAGAKASIPGLSATLPTGLFSPVLPTTPMTGLFSSLLSPTGPAVFFP